MSYGFLPVPVFIAMVSIIAVAMLVYFIKYYKAGKKTLAMICILSSVIALMIVSAKLIQEYFRDYSQYATILIIVGGILFFIELIFIGIAGWENTRYDPQKRKFLKIIFYLFGVWLLLVIALISVAFYLKGKGYF